MLQTTTTGRLAPQARAARQDDELQARAERLYPESAYLQTEWVRAVSVVRSTTGGWLLDHRLARLQ